MIAINSDNASFTNNIIDYSRVLVHHSPVFAHKDSLQKIVERWADYSLVGDLSPHDLSRTAITRALDSGLTYRQVQIMSKHKDPKTVMRYDHGRENLDQNAVNFISYEDM
jgi:integrase